MQQASTFGRFLLQRAQRLLVSRQLRRQHLDRYPGIDAIGFLKAPIQGLVHDTHATVRDPLLQEKPVSQD
jgi:hypothetical protein